MTTATKPDFFIVGAPKCGTTAMYTYLRAHPDIFMPFNKEPHHFAIDLPAPRYERFRNRDAYLALFAPAKTERRVGEASVFYLYSRRAAQEIKTFNPDAQIIIMLRSPGEMLHSFYHQQVFSGEENIPSFADALAMEESRKLGKCVPPDMFGPVQCLFYRDIARYTEQVRRYLELFGREAVHIIIYDDFKANTAYSYQLTLQFLGVDPGFRPDFRVVNQRKRIRSAALRNFLSRPPGWYRQILRAGRVLVPAGIRENVTEFIYRLNRTPVQPSKIAPELLEQLQHEFLPEVEQLSSLLDRDLTHWCRA